MKNVKRSLLTSSVSLLLCFVMLIGTTFAWFTDVATSANNIITAGKLDVSMHWNTDNGTEWKNAEGINAEPIFDYHNWEPGYTEVRYIKVKNEGNLAFQYRMYIDPTGVVGELADVIDVYYDVVTDNNGFTVPTSFYNMGSLTRLGTLRNVISEDISIPGGVLLPEGETENGCYSGEVVICVAFHMQEGANNHYQGESIGDSFGITLHATQYSYEKDSFGTEYDSDAKWPEKPVNLYATKSINGSPLVYGELANEVAINGDKVSATIPAGVKIAENATTLNLTVESTETDANLSLGEDASARGFDVHITGIAADNTQPMIVNLGAVLPAGIDATELKLYHTENGTPVQMTRVASTANFARHNQYVYNEATGEVTIYVASFSTFSMVKASVDAWDGSSDTSWYFDNPEADSFTINSAEEFAGFRDIVDGTAVDKNDEKVQDSFTGKTVTLATDIDLGLEGENGERVSFNPIGYGYTYGKESNTAFMGTFDGQGHTVYNLYQNGWALGYDYSTAGGGLFASIEGSVESPVTIKNLVVSGADIVMECIDMGIVVGYAQGVCHFENIVVTNSKIANYNRATGAVVGEVCYGPYGTDTTKGYSHTFKNIVVDSNVVVSSLWGSFDTLIGGVIGGKWGNATVKMENVITAAELDVYSDVTAAYQWYAYRRCGMLIGHTEQNSPKSALNAAAPFLTCENVEVYYGDWVNYNYYEFANQDSGTGRSYPWVRAEASPVGNNGAFSNPRYGVPTHTVDDVKITVTNENKDTYSTGYAAITFNQLYGGGQGVYGCAEHYGVRTNSKEFKTIYVHNNAGWTNLKLQYWFANGDDTWTTIIDGIDMSTMLVEENVYKIQLPTAVSTFKIVADGENASDVIDLSTLKNNDHYCLKGEHKCSTTVTEPNCLNGGYTTYTCVCGYTYVADHTNALGHDMSKTSTEYTDYFQSDGTETVSCSICSQSIKRTISKSLIYLTPNNNWKEAGARFAAYFFGNGEKWVSMTDFDGDGTYECEVPSGYTKVIFCRMNPKNSTNNWDNKWNQTGDLTVPTNKSNNLYTIKEGSWDSGDWSQLNYTTIYLNPNESWKSEGARFAVYTWYGIDNNNKPLHEMWINMTDVDGNETYEANIRPGYKFIICRMNPNSENAWNDSTNSNRVWAQTSDITNVDDGYTHTIEDSIIYLKPNSNWTTSSARFAIYLMNSTKTTTKWVSMTDANKDGIYECTIPSGDWKYIIFCRMNPSTTSNNFNDGVRWNQTDDLEIYPGGNNLFIINDGSWNEGYWRTK